MKRVCEMKSMGKVIFPFILLMMTVWLSYSVIFAVEAKAGGEKTGTIREISGLTVTVDGKKVDFQTTRPAMMGNRTLVPLRAIFEAMGATVDWNQENRTIYATRKGKAVQLTIDSNKALIDGKEVLLDAPAVVYKGGTLVPLRFVGEAFDGIVDWDPKTQTAAISLAKETVLELPDLQVSLNNKMLEFETPPIFKDGRNYIPLENILKALENNIYWSQEGEEISITFDGAEVKLYPEKNYAVVNGSQVNTTDLPIVYQGVVLVPVRFVTEAFGGIAHFVEETKTTHIYINRPKFKTSFLEKEAGEIVKPVPVPTATPVGSRKLMVSDNPEILNEKTITADRVTLWQQQVDTGQAGVDHRVFGWHINNLGKKVKVAITIENVSQTNDMEITGFQGINRSSPNGWSNYDVGLPLAETVLENKMMNVRMDSPVIPAGETVVLQSFELEKDYLLGFIDDFTVKNLGTGRLQYKIRTVLSQDDADLTGLTGIKSDPVDLDPKNTHPRGNWAVSQLSAEIPPYQVGSGEVAYSFSNGVTDNIFSLQSASPGDGAVMGNPGHYGAVYQVKIPLVNDTGREQTVRIRISGRGGLYAGAVKTPEGVFITPILEPMKETARVIDYQIKGKNDMIQLELMHAGGSALAMAVDITTIE